ncbi:hypothetical protein AALA00_10715 [Lachnospiraceae bacterium 46-15]
MKKLANFLIALPILLLLCTGCGSWQTEKDRLSGAWYCSQSASPALIFYKDSRYSYGKAQGDYALLPDNKLKLTPDSGSETKQTAYICRFSLKDSVLTIFNGNFAGIYKKITSSSPQALLL